MDLYYLGQTTTYFRSLLISSQNALSLDLWKSSFQILDVPINPGDMTPVTWASLLFGRDLYYYCNNKGASIDFVRRRRLCNPCIAVHYTPLYGAHQLSNLPNPTEHLVWQLTAPFYRPDGKDCHATYTAPMQADTPLLSYMPLPR